MKIIKDATSKDRFVFPLTVTCAGCGSTLEAEPSDVHFKSSAEKPRYDGQRLTLSAIGERTPAYFYVSCPICQNRTTVTPNKLF